MVWDNKTNFTILTNGWSPSQNRTKKWIYRMISISIWFGLTFFFYQLYIYIYIFPALVGRVFINDPWGRGSIPGRVIPKTKKNGTSLIHPCLTLCIIGYVSRVEGTNPGKWASPLPPLHLAVIAIGKGPFWSPSTMVANFYLYPYVCVCVCVSVCICVSMCVQWLMMGLAISPNKVLNIGDRAYLDRLIS